MRGCLVLGLVGLLLIGLLGWFVVAPARLRIQLSPQFLPVGDSMPLVAEQIRTFGNEPLHMTFTRTQDQYPGPLRSLFKWTVAPPPAGHPGGQARVDERGMIVGVSPGRVQVEVTAFGETATKDLYIAPRVISMTADPAQLNLRIGEKARLTVRIRLEGAAAKGWQPELGFPSSGAGSQRVGHSPHADASGVPFYAAHADEWWFDVEGYAPGSTTIYLTFGSRELAVPLNVLPDSFKINAHDAGLARELLHQSGYGWQTREFKYGHIHYLRGSHADNNQADLSALIDSTRYRAAAWSVGNDEAPIELFFVDSRDQLQDLVRSRAAGVFRSGERTALFLYNQEFTPLLVQELLQLYAHARWGAPRNGAWLSVGWGASISRACQGYDLQEVMRGQKQDGRVRPWREFARDFENIEEIDAMLQAASMVDYLASLQVPLPDLWHTEGWSVAERKTGRTVAQLDSAWQRTLEVHYPAKRVDREKFYREGCS